MKRYGIGLLLLYIMPVYSLSAVTYETNEHEGGRFGDHLHMFVRACWTAHKNNLPLLVTPFKYCDKLMLYERHEIRTPGRVAQFSGQRKMGQNEVNYHLDRHSNTLYNFSSCSFHDIPYWQDPEFIALMRQELAPRFSLTFEPDRSKVSVALHSRRGGGFDPELLADQLIAEKDVAKLLHRLNNPPCHGWGNNIYGPSGRPYSDVLFPGKFLPMKYFAHQIKVIAQKFEGNPLVIYVFTDESDTKKMICDLQQELLGFDVEIKAREAGNAHDSNVAEDFCALMKCDCLIRSISHFSLWPQLLGDYGMVIAPDVTNDGRGHTHWEIHPDIVNSGYYRCELVTDKSIIKEDAKKIDEIKERIKKRKRLQEQSTEELFTAI